MSHLSGCGWRPANVFAALVFVLFSVSPWKAVQAAAQAGEMAGELRSPARTVDRVTPSYSKIPISFEANQGQTDGSVRFLARSRGYSLFLTPGEAVLALHGSPAKSARSAKGAGDRDNAVGTNLVWWTYLGGSGNDFVDSVALDQHRQVYVVGFTKSANFPLKAPLQTYSYWVDLQPFVTTLSGSRGSIVYYSSYFGVGGYYYSPLAIAIDRALNVYITVSIDDGGGPISGGIFGRVGLGSDVFISKLVIMDDLALRVSSSPTTARHGQNLTYTISVTSKGPDFGVNLRVDDTVPAGTTYVSSTIGGGACTAPDVGIEVDVQTSFEDPEIAFVPMISFSFDQAAGTFSVTAGLGRITPATPLGNKQVLTLLMSL